MFEKVSIDILKGKIDKYVWNEIKQSRKDKNLITMAWIADNKVIAFYNYYKNHKLKYYPFPITLVYFIYVDKDFRNKKIGTHILDELKKTDKHILLKVNRIKNHKYYNDNLKEFYEKNEFVCIDTAINNSGKYSIYVFTNDIELQIFYKFLSDMEKEFS